MSYIRRQVEDGITVMNKELYDNLQDGIDEAKKAVEDLSKVNASTVVQATVEEEV